MAHHLQIEAGSRKTGSRELIESTQSKLISFYARFQNTGPEPIEEVCHKGFAELEERKKRQSSYGIKTGFYDIDNLIGGMRPGNAIVLAGRPGSGKTALAVNIALNAALAKHKTAIFSLEMDQTEIYCRALASEGNINFSSLLRGHFPTDDWSKIGSSSSRLSKLPIVIDDSGSLSLLQLQARCKRLQMDKGLDFVIIDYLGLLQGPGKTIYERVTNISRELKILAKDLKVPILVLSQLHRLEKEDQEPQLSDLRESGAIEQDADVVIFLWRSSDEQVRNCKVAKQRNGPIGSIELGFQGDETRFYSKSQLGF
jgi:replicative DNA helicase